MINQHFVYKPIEIFLGNIVGCFSSIILGLNFFNVSCIPSKISNSAPSVSIFINLGSSDKLDTKLSTVVDLNFLKYYFFHLFDWHLENKGDPIIMGYGYFFTIINWMCNYRVIYIIKNFFNTERLSKSSLCITLSGSQLIKLSLSLALVDSKKE